MPKSSLVGVSEAGSKVARVAPDDNELIARMQAGSVEAFGQLYDRYCARACRVAQSVSRSQESVEDAVQEAFVSIWNSCDTYRPERATAAPWVLTIVRYRAIDIARRELRERTNRHDGQLPEDVASPQDVAQEAAQRVDGVRVRRLIAGLPDAQQEVIVLAFFGQLSCIEIAENLAIPLGTVKSRMRLGLRRLRNQLATPAG